MYLDQFGSMSRHAVKAFDFHLANNSGCFQIISEVFAQLFVLWPLSCCHFRPESYLKIPGDALATV